MSKIICDVCGTSYPDTATQCPICGCVRPVDKQAVMNNGADGEGEGYNGVKGGRFSKSNVRKRNKMNGVEGRPTKQSGSGEGDNRGLVITAIVLLLAIIAVAIYIAVQFLIPGNQNGDDPGSGGSSQIEETVPCDGITLDMDEITFSEAGAESLIQATVTPAGTTDELTFTTSNDRVATVTGEGVVTAIGPGEAVITVKCGSITKQCVVKCIFSTSDLKLTSTNLVLSFAGHSWQLYAGDLDAAQITWTTDDASVATVKDGMVTAVGSGTTKVHAEYNGQKISCSVLCEFTDEGGTSGGVTEDGGDKPDTPDTPDPNKGQYWLDNIFSQYDTECTIGVGQYFVLEVKDPDGKAVSGVTWSVSDDTLAKVEDGYVSGLAKGVVTVTAEYEGMTFTCKVHIV